RRVPQVARPPCATIRRTLSLLLRDHHEREVRRHLRPYRYAVPKKTMRWLRRSSRHHAPATSPAAPCAARARPPQAAPESLAPASLIYARSRSPKAVIRLRAHRPYRWRSWILL